MMESPCLRYLSPAKLNLTLDIVNKRADGYHQIDSLVCLLSLTDEITLIPGSSGIEFIPPNIFATTDIQRNTVYLARNYFNDRLPDNFKIIVKKNIPQQSGLGGGSSNAATILKVLNNLSTKPFTSTELSRIALEIGSDVPLFLHRGKYFRIKGRGEIVEEIFFKNDLFLIIILSGKSVSTTQAYAVWDELKIQTTAFTERFLASENLKYLNNAFWLVISKLAPDLIELKRQLLLMGAPAVGLSGSGSTLFIPFTDKCKRNNFVQILKESTINALPFYQEDLLKTP